MTAAASVRPSLADPWPTAAAVWARARTENFTVASLLAGPRTARRLRAIYLFARLVDELGDAVPGDRAAELDRAEDELDRAFAGAPREPIFVELAAAIQSCRLPRRPFMRLIDANRRDQRQTEYETFDDLLDYCECSANPVGELVLRVFGAADAERVSWSDDVCTALQLLEHWQDVGEDARRGRIYLPREDRARFGVDEHDLLAPFTSPPLRRLLRLETERAAGLLASGRPLVASLRGRARLAVAGYVGGGRAVVAALERSGYDVLAATPRAGRGRRARATASAWRTRT
ncbi:MAG TPA: squalene synthase HpnC [Gaiellaceae bacterium]